MNRFCFRYIAPLSPGIEVPNYRRAYDLDGKMLPEAELYTRSGDEFQRNHPLMLMITENRLVGKKGQ